jgi:hypothetical protein
MNADEINLAIRGLQSLESDLSSGWEEAQKAHPYGARATWIAKELKQVRDLADKLNKIRRIPELLATSWYNTLSALNSLRSS